MGRRLKRRVEIFAGNRGGLRSLCWGASGAAIFLIGTYLGAGLEGLAIWILFGGFLALTPLLVLAGLFYNFQSDPGSALPSFKTLMTLMILCWGALDILALGTFGFAWSDAARLSLLLVISSALAFLIFAQFTKPRRRQAEFGDEIEPLLITYEN